VQEKRQRKDTKKMAQQEQKQCNEQREGDQKKWIQEKKVT